MKNTRFLGDARVTKGEKEVPKRRAETFFRLKQGEFIAFADGRDKLVKFKLQKLEKRIPILLIKFLMKIFTLTSSRSLKH